MNAGNRSAADGQWHSFGGSNGASNAARNSGRSSSVAGSTASRGAGASTAMASRSGASTARNTSVSASRSGNAVSRSTALSGMEHSMLGGSGFGSRSTTTTGSRFGTPFTSHGGTTFNRGGFAGSGFGNRGAFAGSGFGRGFGRDRFDHDRFGRCFGCGFGFGFGSGFGFGFGFGFGGWGWGGPWGFWGPGWGWDPWWPGYVYAPYPYPYSYSAPYPDQYPTDPIYGDYSTPRSDSSRSNVYRDNSPSGDYDPAPYSRDSYEGNSNPSTGNVAASTPTVLLYLKDGTTFAATDYWVADGKLHYFVNYSGESTVDIDQLDVQRTVDENSKRGVQFTLKPKPNRWSVEPSTTDKDTGGAATGTPSKESDDKSNSLPATTPEPKPAPAPRVQSTSGSQT
jgi:hypothetical protein